MENIKTVKFNVALAESLIKEACKGNKDFTHKNIDGFDVRFYSTKNRFDFVVKVFNFFGAIVATADVHTWDA